MMSGVLDPVISQPMVGYCMQNLAQKM